MLLTIELNPGLELMTVFDAAAAPMADIFQNPADLAPCTRLAARVPVDEKNPAPPRSHAGQSDE